MTIALGYSSFGKLGMISILEHFDVIGLLSLQRPSSKNNGKTT